MKIYTKTGDQGMTSLLSGKRVTKSDPRLEAYGNIDELNSMLGWCLTALKKESAADSISKPIANAQHHLFVIGSHLACDADSRRGSLPSLNKSSTEELESAIDAMDTKLPALKNFILPGGSEVSARLHLARTICRRAERSCASLSSLNIKVDPEHLIYMNRLSDFLFVAARFANQSNGITETEWRKNI